MDHTPTQPQRSPSHSRLISAGQDSNSAFGTPRIDLGISGHENSPYHVEEDIEYIRGLPNFRNAGDVEDDGSDSDYDSPEALRAQEERRNKEAAERIFKRRSQNPMYSERQLPPPVMLEMPTAHDVRFGIKGAKSPGWEDVRRRSQVSPNGMVNSPDGAGGWRRSFFGGSAHSTAASSSTSLPSKNNVETQSDLDEKTSPAPQVRGDTPLSINVEGEFGQIRRAPVATNPYATFVRPISMAPDESLKMIRGDRSDMLRFSNSNFIPASKESYGHGSLSSSANSDGPGRQLYNESFRRSLSPPATINTGRDPSAIPDKFNFLPDDFDVFVTREAEPDDDLHDPGPRMERKGADRLIIESKALAGRTAMWSTRGWLNAIGLLILAATLVTLFAGYPIISYFVRHPFGTLGGFNLGGINASGQVPEIQGFRGLIDVDTPRDVLTKTGIDGNKYQLVFSDEFNEDGRTFWPGDDPYWEAVDLHYWATKNLEWYDPDQATTQNGSLILTLDQADPTENHDLDYRGGMIQTWNKFCFTGGIIEASISLPGDPTVAGLWPAFWTMGNLGRAGYGASLDGTWPYSYDTCDIGTLPNQTDPKTGGPAAVTTMGDPYNDNNLSYLPGQRLSRCTCSSNSGPNYHPGPKHKDGSFVGRSAPEIDILEGTLDRQKHMGQISQSAQFAPYNAKYTIDNKTNGYATFYNNKYEPGLNAYTGGVYQQSASGLSNTDQDAYDGQKYANYGFEYAPSDYANPYITWTQQDEAMWTLTPGAVGPDKVSQIGQRVISNEPMYILFNLGISPAFGAIEFKKLKFPAKMRVDWVRVYQPVGSPNNIGCSPPQYPTESYIRDHKEAYTNANLTTWLQYQEKHGDGSGNAKTGFPKNNLIDTC